jgi:hypothetical protein
VATRRRSWLLLPLAFLIAFRAALWVYWLPERTAWVASHGGDPTAAAYGQGEMDAVATISAAGPFLISVVCFLIGGAPRPRAVLAIGVIPALGALGLGYLGGEWLAHQFGGSIPIHAPAVCATATVVAFQYARRSFA